MVLLPRNLPMCLIALSWQPEQDQRLLLLANRDEQHARPAAPLAFWDDAPEVLAGRDLSEGGTWLGVNRQGRFAALTNFREPGAKSATRSRGHLVAEFLRGDMCPQDYASRVQPAAYAGFNLLLGDRETLVYLSNRDAAGARILPPGIYGLSNALLDTPWPKLRLVRDALRGALNGPALDPAQAMHLMQRREPFPDRELPDTGVGLGLERMLSPPFICTPVYGTRCTTWLSLSSTTARICERSFDPAGGVSGECEETLPLAGGP